ncbi:transmembrane protein 80-like isoform X3 [Stegodyphus dumicola]|uniref:transmembrane protein 80-like isoform X3 n=1 Tax=Stegodyphus dumicola TaxID=202533 RepID=UPI0015A9C531|nr:transmembrane protein 80-like isoform X3 [Stegodyphus dumicola]
MTTNTKEFYFVYPFPNFLSEVALLFFLFGVESVRNFLGQKGNLTERMLSVVLSLLLTVPVVAGVCYFLWWQTYVLMIDVILSVILLVFLSLQCLFSIFTLFTFKR